MNKNIVLYPEVLSSVIKNKEEDIFTLWLFAKKIDINKNGIVPLNEILNIAKLTLGLESTYVYNKIKKGIGLYWRQPNGKNGSKTIGLFSINKIIERLSPEITRVKPVIVNQNIFKSESLNLKNLRTLYIAIVAGRYADNRPISIQALVNNLGISESTIHNAIKNFNHIKVFNNFKVISEFENLLDARKYILSCHSPKLKIVNNNNKFSVTEQLPNSYVLFDFDRLPLRARPRALKQNDKLMLDKIEEARYHINGQYKTINNHKIITSLSYTSE